MKLIQRITSASDYLEWELIEYPDVMVPTVVIFAECATFVKNFIYATIFVWLVNGTLPWVFPNIASTLDFKGVLMIATLYALWRNDGILNAALLSLFGYTKLSIVAVLISLTLLLFVTPQLLQLIWNDLIPASFDITVRPMGNFVASIITVIGLWVTSNQHDDVDEEE